MKQLLQLHQPRITEDLAKVYAFDYQTRKELLVFVYYLCEYNDSFLLKQALQLSDEAEPKGGKCILDEFEKVILVYQSNDPYLVQVALSVMSLVSQICSNSILDESNQRSIEGLHNRISQPNLLEAIENIAVVFKSENPDVALMAQSFLE